MTTTNIKKVGWWGQNFYYPLKFGFEKRRATLVPLGLFLIVYVCIVWSTNTMPSIKDSLSENFLDTANHINIVLQLMTLFIVIIVWLAQLRHDWQDSLKKKLSVKFSYDKKVYDHLTTEFVPLLSEADTRSLGQSLGQLKNDNKHLPLDSRKNKLRKSICIRTGEGEEKQVPFWHYQMEMPLREELKEENKEIKGFIEKIGTKITRLEKNLHKTSTEELVTVMDKIVAVLDDAAQPEAVVENDKN